MGRAWEDEDEERTGGAQEDREWRGKLMEIFGWRHRSFRVYVTVLCLDSLRNTRQLDFEFGFDADGCRDMCKMEMDAMTESGV